MKKKSAAFVLVCMLGLACIIPNLTIASTDTTPTFNVEDGATNFQLDFSTDSQLLPGSYLQKNIIFNNKKDIVIELVEIGISDIVVKKKNEDPTDEEYAEFMSTTKFTLKNKGIVVFDALLQDLASGAVYIPNPRVFFNRNCGDEFDTIITMLPESSNLTQNMSASFKMIYSFKGSGYTDPGDPPNDDPDPPNDDPDPPNDDPEEPQDDPDPPVEDPEEPSDDPEPPVEDPEEPSNDPEEPTEDSDTPPEEEPESIIIDDEIPKMGMVFDNYMLLGIGGILVLMGTYLLFFRKKKRV